MSTSVRITVAEYDRMIAEGRFEPREEHHVELIEGEIIPMSPIGEDHSDLVNELNEWSARNAPLDEVRVQVQNPIVIPALDSMPEPDIVWLRRRPYRRRRPEPEDVLLLVEVSASSLAFDRTTNSSLVSDVGSLSAFSTAPATRTHESAASAVYSSIR